MWTCSPEPLIREATTTHPPREPFASGRLRRPGGVELYWESSGNPHGRPALYVHGGPGSGLGSGGYRRRFDPAQYLIVGLYQRGCGRSTPWAIDDLEHLEANNTQTLVAVTTGGRTEIEWITEGVGAIFPEAWAELAADVPRGQRLIEHYAARMRDPDAAVRAAAADRWDRWESTHVSLDPAWRPGLSHEDPRTRQKFAALVTHYWVNDCFLSGDDAVLARAADLAGIPGVLIHGRYDVSGPAVTAWRPHRVWPGSRFEIAETEGHGGEREMELTTEAIDGFARPR